MRTHAFTLLRERLSDRRTLMQTGMAFLAVALVSKWILHPRGETGHDVLDAAIGVLVGMSLGCLLLSLRTARRR